MSRIDSVNVESVRDRNRIQSEGAVLMDDLDNLINKYKEIEEKSFGADDTSSVHTAVTEMIRDLQSLRSTLDGTSQMIDSLIRRIDVEIIEEEDRIARRMSEI
ncbi:MAG: hypothetical protein J6U54_09515 [Clostridiales bacterium]|nr:hypothetical protein [Clostridiales bacterium]